MRIRELEIDRFGVWRDVSLPMNTQGPTVLYGPNEAGKSTLLRFIRGVLYGFRPQDERSPGPQGGPVACAGSLLLEQGGQDYRLRRVSEPGSRGRLEINGRRVSDEDELLHRLVGGASEALFTNVFAIGLNELQQLATLNGEEVARHIYGLSLGPDGLRILKAQEVLAHEQERRLPVQTAGGEIRELLRELARVDRELAALQTPLVRREQLRQRQQELERRIDQLQSQQNGLKRNLRGHQFIQRAWGPWKKEQELRRQLDRLPVYDIPPEVLDRFDELELEIEEVSGTRRRQLEDFRQLTKQAEAQQIRPEFEELACRIINLHEQQTQMQAIERRLQEGPSRPATSQALTADLSSMLQALPGHWTSERLERAHVGSVELQSILQQAENLRSARRRRNRIVRKYKRLAAALQRKQGTLANQKKFLGQQAPEAYREQLVQRIGELERLQELRTRRDQLLKVLELVQGPSTRRIVGHELPPFFSMVLWFFAVGGIVMLGCGLYAVTHNYAHIVQGEWTALLVGIIYALMGSSALALKHTMTEHFASQEVQLVNTGEEQQRLRRELSEVEAAIDKLTRRDALRPPLSAVVPQPGDPVQLDEPRLLADLRKQLVQLETVSGRDQPLERYRARQARLRQLLQDVQREVSRQRRDWSELLKKLGLPEDLTPHAAVQALSQLMQARTVWQQRLLSSQQGEHLERDRQQLADYRKQVEALAVRLHGPAYRVYDPYRVVAEWNQEVEAMSERRRERRRLKLLAKEKRAELSRLEEKLKRLQSQRAALLTRLNVASREEITERLQTLEQRSLLERQAQEIRHELLRLSQAEPELALVEDDFRSFDEVRHQRTVQETQQELERLDQRLRESFEELGQLRTQLRDVEDDRRLTSLRFERVQLEAALEQATRSWCAARSADQLIAILRERLERHGQPEALQQASRYLQQLTCGRYHNIWTQLGDRTLFIDDDQGHSLRVEQLSSGTREQVFLSIRLAMIDGFAKQGMELPLVLDDVTVNFDQIRTEAAVRTLLDVAQRGQQLLLFTCHLHVTHLFQQEGIEPTFLPTQAVAA
jgi:uncharacterized protein YhaN